MSFFNITPCKQSQYRIHKKNFNKTAYACIVYIYYKKIFYLFAKRFCTLIPKGFNNVGVKFQFNIYKRTRDISDWKKITEMGDPLNVAAALKCKSSAYLDRARENLAFVLKFSKIYIYILSTISAWRPVLATDILIPNQIIRIRLSISF